MSGRRPEPGDLVSRKVAAAIVGVSQKTIAAWCKAGKVEWEYTAGGAVRIWRDTLLRAKQTEMTAAQGER